MSSDQPNIILPDGGPDYQEIENERLRRKGPWIGVRHIFAFLGFLGFVNVYAMRVNLSVAIVAMVNSTNQNDGKHNSSDGTCPADIAPMNTTDNNNDAPFNWDAETQSLVLGCFFYGYVLTQLPGGRLAEILGGKWIFGFGILLTSIFTVIMPWAAKTDLKLLVAVRVIEGLGEGVTFPVMHAMLANWSPPLELSRLNTFVYTGSTLGTIISMPLTGIICDYLGWEAAFYIFGSCGIVWFICWALLVYEAPETHPRISEEEKDLILTSQGKRPFTVMTRSVSIDSSIVSDLDGSDIVYDDKQPIITTVAKKKPKIPLRAIFTSRPFYAILIVHCAQNWGFYTLLTELPTYLNEILHFNLKENGFLSALPYVCMWIVANLGSQLADYVRTRSILSTRNTRKVFNSFAFLIPALALVLIKFAGCDKTLVVALICICVGCNGFSFISINCNHIDIAPNFAGTLMGITNCVANTAGFLAPMAVAKIIEGHEDIDHWQTVFYIAAGVYVVGNLLFCIMASGEIQPWNKITDDEFDPTILPSDAPTTPQTLGPIMPSTSQDLIEEFA